MSSAEQPITAISNLNRATACYDFIVDVVEKLTTFALFTRDIADYLEDRYSELRESAADLSARVNQSGH